MVEHVVELAQNGSHVSLWRGFMRVENTRPPDGGEPTRRDVPLDLLQAVVMTAPQGSISRNLLAELAERNIPLIVCGKNFHPTGLYLPHQAYHAGTEVLHWQIEASLPLKKRLWQQVVRAKIRHQAEVLEALGDTVKAEKLYGLVGEVASGDAGNKEAHAARIYWKGLFGEEFSRNIEAEDANRLLNYGYAVLRAATARAICGCGLQPALGVFHSNKRNAFCLVDDMMEIYRPLVDAAVKQWCMTHPQAEVTTEAKKHLTALLKLDLRGDRGLTPLTLALQDVAVSYRQSLEMGQANLRIAEIPDVSCWGGMV